ncbi:ATP-dependent DNA helicase RecG [Alicyclobacillus cycloheptanicus]|uniref:ATP-dependent DNA helicase RecG n=1 Tax=Alicyclobacillus cycloheptanicus TaxID=1457 RepID=A0ABT9XLF4_9BACL|nr:ATP-dependent DNA helicase RecG [Alicyclobacillus cycloheptanicus]MDQ0190849.1 ATP-dependent DNA helicase RecG [Alicyclobacillus cycloheptanicus]WDM01453.1 ATP-dependent DNA helicase RecG [Alicyclobacillus cycloheptanicus]
MLRETPVSHVAGIGRAKEKALAELGIHSVFDLLHHFPVRYEDRSIRPFESFEDGAKVTARAVVEGQPRVRWHGGKRSVLSVPLRIDQRFRVTGMWFNQPYLSQKLTDGRMVLVHGKYDRDRNVIVVSHTDFSMSASDAVGAFVPVYRTGQGITSAQMQALIARALQQFGEAVDDVLPHAFLQKYRLVTHLEAIRLIHAPKSAEELRQAHRRLAFEEFFLFQLQLQWFRAQQHQVFEGVARVVPTDAFERFCASLPQPLTAAQVRACQAVAADMARPRAMARLLQGDVGSGKTWVAFWAAYATFRTGAQTALMAPTEILAEQHYHNAQERLVPLGMRVRLLTGSTPSSERTAVLQALANGGIDLLVGTHALLTEDVVLQNLGLVITDEQHRFGVSQRSLLRAKGHTPDVFMLTATPIPRTLALAVYGDLDVSVLDELPAGRRPVETRWLPMQKEEEALRLARRELARGRQVYVVAPLVEQSEQLADVQSAAQLADNLKDAFAGYTVGLLHGKMSTRDKEAVMRDFVAGNIHVLVSTTVIEVGIDVKAATVMLVYHAERFGLAQLHQLRGRVGRGSAQSYCILLSDAEGEVAKRRLQTLVETTDGFVIAERDLELRGPGEFLGVRQSGLPEFTVGDIARDFRIMEVAREEASRLLANHDFWLLPKFARLRAEIEKVPEQSYYRD